MFHQRGAQPPVGAVNFAGELRFTLCREDGDDQLIPAELESRRILVDLPGFIRPDTLLVHEPLAIEPDLAAVHKRQAQ